MPSKAQLSASVVVHGRADKKDLMRSPFICCIISQGEIWMGIWGASAFLSNPRRKAFNGAFL